jgi:hypothetical protein
VGEAATESRERNEEAVNTGKERQGTSPIIKHVTKGNENFEVTDRIEEEPFYFGP